MQTPALISTSWLARNLQDPGLRVLDCSWYLPMMDRDAKKEFAQTHIPGAAFFDIDKCTDPDSKFDHSMPSERFFSEYVGNLGIGNQSHVVVYDASDFGAFTCSRVWWMFRLFGHPRVSLLDGGFKKWVKEGHPVTSAVTRPELARFNSTINRSWVKTFEEVTDNISSQKFQLVDARSHERFWGKEPEPKEGVDPGHIPGSKCMPFFEFMDEDGLMLPPEELRNFFQRSQVDLSQPLCGTCGSGVTACHVVLAAHLCGAPDASVYVGSWFEWFTKAPPQHILPGVKRQL
ncbi:thiosulfate sulfurtransferase-like [Synchiropus splendidus]|uniref:thiosulfate sulfurtransferase-like n=1 Tax=Synchiropus splendidus TaxID=270530 RepID=UPI00237E9711|nr:thiosulfate sulfurtransferase-like [Synchiropus splendidus]